MEQYRCRICLEYSTEQITAEAPYLDTLKLEQTLDGSSNELMHICVSCAKKAEAVCNFKEPYEEADYKLELNEEIIIEEKAEAVKIEDVNDITFTTNTASNWCKSEDESISNYRDCRDSCSSLTEEDNYAKLLNKIKVELDDGNTMINLNAEDVNINSSYFETIEKSNYSCLKVETNIVSESEQTLEASLKNKYVTSEETSQIYCDKTSNYGCNLRKHNKSDYTNHVEAAHADEKTKSNHCDKTFFDTRALKKSKIYECEVCGSIFTLKSCLSKHLKEHEQNNRFNCSKCGKCYKHLNTLKSHTASKTCEASALYAFVCKICEKRFATNWSLHHHNKVAHNIQETVCYFCDFLPKSRNELKRHIEQKHADKKSWACKDCGKTFLQPRYLKNHLLIHKRNDLYSLCGRKFNSRVEMVEHMEKHSRDKSFNCEENKDSYVCKLCNKDFAHLTTFRKHNKAVHDIHMSCYYCEYIPTSSNDSYRHIRKEHADKRNVACNQCDGTFFSFKDLKSHFRQHRNRSYECTICNYKCTTKFLLIRHLRKHTGERPFQCFDCGKAFKQKHSLGTHLAYNNCKIYIKNEANPTNSERIVVKHTESVSSRIYACKVCDKKFAQRSCLRTHTKNIHKIKDISCYFCDYVPDSTGDLRKHSEKEHADKKTMTCEYCDKTFFERADLRDHFKVHNTAEKHMCEICGSKFAMESHLIEHMTIHTGEKHFKCFLCDRSFRFRAGLTKHLGSTHRGELRSMELASVEKNIGPLEKEEDWENNNTC